MKTTTFDDKYEYIDDKYFKKGGFGEIYRIRDKNIKTEYILKKIKKEKSFKNEINFLIDVKGTNIININDFYDNKNENCYYLILEKMDGDLNMMLNNYKNGMSPKLIRKIFSQINTGLKIILNKGKTHHDLKPSNILFSYTNDKKTDFIVKIGDFGLAKELKSTREESIVGTPFFRAPEIMDGKHSNKCDLYSIGVILYVLKTGDKFCKNLIEYFVDLNVNDTKKNDDNEKLNNLMKKLVVSDPHKRMEWKDYFEDPFFNINDEDNKNNEECKLKILIILSSKNFRRI